MIVSSEEQGEGGVNGFALQVPDETVAQIGDALHAAVAQQQAAAVSAGDVNERAIQLLAGEALAKSKAAFQQMAKTGASRDAAFEQVVRKENAQGGPLQSFAHGGRGSTGQMNADRYLLRQSTRVSQAVNVLHDEVLNRVRARGEELVKAEKVQELRTSFKALCAGVKLCMHLVEEEAKYGANRTDPIFLDLQTRVLQTLGIHVAFKLVIFASYEQRGMNMILMSAHEQQKALVDTADIADAKLREAFVAVLEYAIMETAASIGRPQLEFDE